MINLKEVYKNVYFKYFLAFCIGCIISIFILPTKTIIKKVEVENEIDKKIIEDYKNQIASLEKKYIELSNKKRTIIIEKPDGSKTTEITSETNTKETTTKETIEKYERQLKEDQKEISRLKEYSKIEINKKAFNIGLGFDLTPIFNSKPITFKNLYLRTNYDILNFITIGSNVGFNLIMVDTSFKL